jgi:hypothetical protein
VHTYLSRRVCFPSSSLVQNFFVSTFDSAPAP